MILSLRVLQYQFSMVTKSDTRFVISNAFFQLSLLLLNSLLLDPSMLLWCCMLRRNIVLSWHFLDFVFLCLCLRQALFMSDGCVLSFIIVFIFIIIDHLISFKADKILFYLFYFFIFKSLSQGLAWFLLNFLPILTCL